MINLSLVLSEVNAELIQLVHEQRDACLLYPSGRNAQRLTELILLPVGVPIPR